MDVCNLILFSWQTRLAKQCFSGFSKTINICSKDKLNYGLIMIFFIVKYLEWSLYIRANVIIKQKLGVNILWYTKKANKQMYMLYYKGQFFD